MDFFTVPTASLRVLYVFFHVFFVIGHGRRRILRFNATFNPTGAWVVQQLRDAFPYDAARKYLIFDRDAIFKPTVVDAVKAMWASSPVGSSTEVLGRIPWPNAGSATTAASYSNTSLFSAGVI